MDNYIFRAINSLWNEYFHGLSIQAQAKQELLEENAKINSQIQAEMSRGDLDLQQPYINFLNQNNQKVM